MKIKNIISRIKQIILLAIAIFCLVFGLIPYAIGCAILFELIGFRVEQRNLLKKKSADI
tara:strand:+ start:887 stop:1063 length:177 start_codon:yes stop_codon:yes gene_type:complete